jgi:hypothetical protein
MADPFTPVPGQPGLYLTNASTVESPAGSHLYALLDVDPDPVGSGLYPFEALPLPQGVYWDWGFDGSTGRVTVTNDGTTETFPDIRVSGGLTGGFIITDITSGRVVSLARNIPLGSYVSINQRTGSVTIDGQSDISGFLTSYGFFSIGPGETHVIQFSPIGTVIGDPIMTLTIQDGYL